MGQLLPNTNKKLQYATVLMNFRRRRFRRQLNAALAINLSPCLVPPQLPKICYGTCYIECLRPVHGALNIDEKKLIAQLDEKLRDEHFEPN